MTHPMSLSPRAALLAAGTACAWAAVMLAVPAQAQAVKTPAPGDLSFGVSAGTRFQADGTFHKGAAAGPASVRSRDWSDAYDRTWTLEGEAAYGLTDRSELALTLGWSWANASAMDVGSVAGQPLRAKFDDYDAWSLRATYRQYFDVSPTFIPYVGISGGVRYTDSIDAELRSDGFTGLGQPAVLKTGFYKKSWIPTAGLTFGWRYHFSGAVVGLETGVFYDWKPRDDDSVLAAQGLARLNDAGDRITIPLTLTVAF